MAGQVAAGQPGQRLIRVPLRRRRPEPVPDQHEGLVTGRGDRAAEDQAAQRGGEQLVHQGLPGRADPGRIQPVAELAAGERAVGGQRCLDHRHGPLGVSRPDLFLGQPAGAARAQLRGGERVQPPVVLGADQVQRAPVQPGDDQGPVRGQRAVDVGGGQPARPGADGQPQAARILSLDGKQPPDHVRSGPGGLAGQQLGFEPLAHDSGSGRRVGGHPPRIPGASGRAREGGDGAPGRAESGARAGGDGQLIPVCHLFTCAGRRPNGSLTCGGPPCGQRPAAIPPAPARRRPPACTPHSTDWSAGDDVRFA